MRYLIFIFLSLVKLHAYEVDDVVNSIDQQKSFDICYGGDGEFKLADYNGDLNGGMYRVIVVDMSATWCGLVYQ